MKTIAAISLSVLIGLVLPAFADQEAERTLERLNQQLDQDLSTSQLRSLIPQYEKLVAAFERTSLRERLCTCINNLGVIYARLGQFPKALECHERALAMGRQSNDLRQVGGTLHNMAGIYEALGQRQKAIELYREALLIANKLGEQGLVNMLLENLAKFGVRIN